MFFAPGILAETPGDYNINTKKPASKEYSQLCCEQLQGREEPQRQRLMGMSLDEDLDAGAPL